MKKYVYKPYHEFFLVLYEREKERIIAGVSQILFIEHVGSTAIAGLGGKGIIDIAIAANKDEWSTLSEDLQKLTYVFRPKHSTPDRLFFKTHLPDPIEKLRTYHLHLTYPDSKDWKGMIAFRDYLKSHPGALQDYARLKEQAAIAVNEDGEKYRKLKEPFIQEILAKATGDNGKK